MRHQQCTPCNRCTVGFLYSLNTVCAQLAVVWKRLRVQTRALQSFARMVFLYALMDAARSQDQRCAPSEPSQGRRELRLRLSPFALEPAHSRPPFGPEPTPERIGTEHSAPVRSRLGTGTDSESRHPRLSNAVPLMSQLFGLHADRARKVACPIFAGNR